MRARNRERGRERDRDRKRERERESQKKREVRQRIILPFFCDHLCLNNYPKNDLKDSNGKYVDLPSMGLQLLSKPGWRPKPNMTEKE